MQLQTVAAVGAAPLQRRSSPFSSAGDRIAHGPLPRALLVALGDVAGHDLEAVVTGEIEIAGVEDEADSPRTWAERRRAQDRRP